MMCFNQFITNIQKCLGKGSGRIIDSVTDHIIQNIGNNECFNWSIIRYFNPAHHYPARITKAEKDFTKKHDIKDKKTILAMKIRKSIQFMYQKKCCEEKYVDLFLNGEEGKIHYVLISHFNIFMYDHTLHCGKNYFVVVIYKPLLQKKY